MGKTTIEKIKRKVEKFKKNIEKKFFVEKVIIFGSAAKGKIKKDSDIDIIVVSKRYGRRDVFKIVPKLYGEWHEKAKIDFPVDILLFNTKEFDKSKKEISIVSEALKEGIEV
jgi:predicted nucleotidyltransferase